MELLSAPLPGTESVTPPYGTSLALALVLFLTFAVLQTLLWVRVRRLWLRLVPLWLSGLLCLVFLLCVITCTIPMRRDLPCSAPWPACWVPWRARPAAGSEGENEPLTRRK